MRDENQIAFGILRTLTMTAARPGDTPQSREARSRAVAGGQASKERVPLDQRRANGLRGAIARWGTIREIIPAMPASRKNLDINQLAKRILDEATGDEPKTEAPVPVKKNKAAVALGKIGGKKGGAARAASLTPEQRAEIAKKAAASRWGKTKAE